MICTSVETVTSASAVARSTAQASWRMGARKLLLLNPHLGVARFNVELSVAGIFLDGDDFLLCLDERVFLSVEERELCVHRACVFALDSGCFELSSSPLGGSPEFLAARSVHSAFMSRAFSSAVSGADAARRTGRA